MSLVVGFLCDDYVMLCGDRQLNHFNGEKSNAQKVYYFNNQVIWGFTGRLSTNTYLLRDYTTNNYFDINKTSKITFEELCQIHKNYYSTLLDEYYLTGNIPDFNCFIGGIVGNHFALQRYTIIESTKSSELLISEPDIIQHSFMGNLKHKDYLPFLMPDHFPSPDDIVNIPQYRNYL